MKIKKHVSIIASMLVYLIISLPIVFAQEINYVLDANGNLVTGDGFYREYNELNQLIRIRESNLSTGKILEEYTWHPVEERILIKDVYYNNTKNYTIYYLSKEYVVIENQTGNYTEEYIYQDNVLVAQVDTNGNKVAVHPDHEGSSTTFTNAQENVLETTFYSAYGEILSGGKTSRFDYESKEYDSLVKDYDFGFRKYNPDVPPIFHQPDTLIQNVYDPQSLNRYAFERNNPQKNIDPTGHCPWCLLAAGGFVVGSFTYMFTHSGSGWSHVGNTFAAGGITAGALAGSYAFATVGGRVAASSGLVGTLTATGNFLVGAGAEVAGEALEDEDLDPRSIVIAGITNIPQYGLRLRPGTPMGSIHSNNFLKFIGQQIGGAIANFGANWLINSANNIADNSNKASVVSSSTSSGGWGGGTSTLGSNS